MSQQLASDNFPFDSGQGEPLLGGSQSLSARALSQAHPSVTLAWGSGYPRAKFCCPRSRGEKRLQDPKQQRGQEVSTPDFGLGGWSAAGEWEEKRLYLTSPHERNMESW